MFYERFFRPNAFIYSAILCYTMTAQEGEAEDEGTQIRVKKRTLKALREIGKMGESYDDVISRLAEEKKGGM
jgi:hypothetical protein